MDYAEEHGYKTLTCVCVGDPFYAPLHAELLMDVYMRVRLGERQTATGRVH
jgi:hypothetical protein